MVKNKSSGNNRDVLIVGLTGGIGSGKSTVLSYFQDMGISCFSADCFAKKAMITHQSDLVDYFGDCILDSEQKIDRSVIRALIFEDPKASEHRSFLNKLLHPTIRSLIQHACAHDIKSSYGIVEIPLLAENFKHYKSIIHRVLVVDTLESIQVERVKTMRNWSSESIQAIIHAQISRLNRRACADDVIENAGSLKSLAYQVNGLHQIYTHWIS